MLKFIYVESTQTSIDSQFFITNQNIEYLDLSNFIYLNYLPDEITLLHNLKYLNLSNTNIKRI